MKIALIAQNRKKELMAQFCIAYKGILAEHSLCATASTAKHVSDATGLKIESLLSGTSGGIEQISARVAYDEIDLVLAFRDHSEKYTEKPELIELMRLCDMNSIPVATNLATAEVLILGLSRGDLAWREILKTK